MINRIAAACAAVGLALGAGLAPASAETTITPVLKTMLEGMPNTEANVLVLDVDPGYVSDYHHHPGHLVVYILEGTLHVEIDGQEPRDVTAGEAIYEVPGVSMTARNVSTTDRAKFVVFQFGEAGQPIMVTN